MPRCMRGTRRRRASLPPEAVTAAQDAFSRVYNDPLTLTACLNAALAAAAPLIAAKAVADYKAASDTANIPNRKD